MSVYRKLATAAVLAVGLILPLGAGVASAQCDPGDDYCNPEGPSVLPNDAVAPGAPAQVEVPAEAAPAPAAAAQEAPSGGLPLTGGDVVGMTIIGAGAVAIGTVLVRRSKRAGAAAA